MSKRMFEKIDREIAQNIFEEITLAKLNGKTPEYTDEQIKILRDFIYVASLNFIIGHLDYIGDEIHNIAEAVDNIPGGQD